MKLNPKQKRMVLDQWNLAKHNGIQLIDAEEMNPFAYDEIEKAGKPHEMFYQTVNNYLYELCSNSNRQFR